jgi:chemotaxis family two-component system response regulator Rcp1
MVGRNAPKVPCVSQPAIRILIAEDNEGDVYLVRHALERHGLPHKLVIARNGEEALDMLRDTAQGPAAAMPELILLDLNLPRVGGAQILSHIRQSEAFKETPVIVLTSSDSPRDRELALRLGASLYVRKPVDLTSFLMLGQVIQETAQKARNSLA